MIPMTRTSAALAVSLAGAFAPFAAHAVNQMHTFTGPWAPTAANGFNRAATGGLGEFDVTVSPDGSTLTAQIQNPDNLNFGSFFLENYGFAQDPPILLPIGPVSYDYRIQYFSATGGIFTFDDFNNAAFVYSGDSITGSASYNYGGGYFGYFGVNIRGFNPETGELGVASATITLTNFSAPVPEPAPFALLAAGLAALAVLRSRRTRG